MKLDPIKFGLAAGTSASVLMFVKLLFVRIYLCFAPYGIMRQRGICVSTGGFFMTLLMFIVNILVTFLVVSFIGWLFAWMYNKLLSSF